MPEVNLLKNTDKLEEPDKKPEPAPGSYELTDPSVKPAGLGGFLKSLIRRGSPNTPLPDAGQPIASSLGRMSMKAAKTGERILNEKKSERPTGVIPLPDDQGGFNVNLLTEDLVQRFEPKKKLTQLGLIAGAAVALVLVIVIGLTVFERSVLKQIDDTQVQLTQLEQELVKLRQENKRVTLATQKVKAIRSLVDRHIRWTKFFTKIEQYTLPSVSYGGTFSGDIAGQMGFSATTSSFEEVAKQYLLYQAAVTAGDFITSFEISGATASQNDAGGTVVAFNVVVQLHPDLLYNHPSAPAGTDITQDVQQISSAIPSSGQSDGAASSADLGSPANQLELMLCALKAQPEAIDTLPSAYQSSVRTRINQASMAVTCATKSSDDRTTAGQLIALDADADGLNALIESIYGTDDSQADTDDDSTNDLVEIIRGSNPLGLGNLDQAQDLLRPFFGA